MGRFCGGGSPAKRRVAGNQDPRHMQGILFAYATRDGQAGVPLVVRMNFLLRKGLCDGDGAVEVIGMRRPETRNGAPCLRPRRGSSGMSVSHPADRGERIVKNQVCGQVRGWPKVPFDGPAFEVDDDQMFRLHGVVRNTAWFNDHQSVFSRNAAGVTESVEDQAAADELQIGLQYLLAKLFESHAFPLAAAAMRRSVGRTRPAETGAASLLPKAK